MSIKSLFPGYFSPTEDKFQELWSNAEIVLDTNILLNILCYSEKTRAEVTETLDNFKSRIWIPHHVAFEFSRNWRGVDARSRSAYSKLVTAINTYDANICSSFDEYSRHQTIDCEREKKRIKRLTSSLIASLKKCEESHPSHSEVEDALISLSNLIGERIGTPPSPEEMKARKQAADERFEKKIPPGYLDTKKDNDNRYGDYLIWREIIDHSNSTEKPIIFVSDDRKEDWIFRIDGKDIGPRPELVHEFTEKTGRNFHSYSLRSFLDHANAKNSAKVSSKAIAEVADHEREIQEGYISPEIFSYGLFSKAPDQRNLSREHIHHLSRLLHESQKNLNYNEMLNSFAHAMDPNTKSLLDAQKAIAEALSYTMDPKIKSILDAQAVLESFRKRMPKGLTDDDQNSE
jgi:hypothetical protein